MKRRDVLQIAPKVRPRDETASTASGANDGASLFPSLSQRPRIFSKIADWAETFHPPSPEPLKLSASAVDNYRKCPQQFLFGRMWSLKEGPQATLTFGSVMHTTIKRFRRSAAEGREAAVRGGGADFRDGMDFRGI